MGPRTRRGAERSARLLRAPRHAKQCQGRIGERGGDADDARVFAELRMSSEVLERSACGRGVARLALRLPLILRLICSLFLVVECDELVVVCVRHENGEEAGRLRIARIFADGVMRARLLDPVLARMEDLRFLAVDAAAN